MSAPPPPTTTPPAKGRTATSTLRDFHEEERLGKTYDTKLLARLWPFLRPHQRFLWTSLVIILMVAALNLSRPLVMGQLIQAAQDARPQSLMRHGIILSLLILGMQLLTFVQAYTMQIAGARTMADLRSTLFQFMQRLSLRYYDRTPVGRLVTRATNDVDAVGELFASGVINAVGDLLALVGIVIMMLLLDVRMSLIAFATMPAVGLLVWYVRGRARQAYRDIRVKTARMNAFLNEQVSGMSVVQAYARESHMAAEFDGINVEYRDANKQAVYYEAVLDAAIEMVGTVCIASILWWAGLRKVNDPTITFPLVVVFTQYIKQFFEPVSLLAQRYTILQSAMSGAERVFKLLEETDLESQNDDVASDPARREADRAAPPDEAVGLENVTFGYKEGTPVLREVSLHVKKGERVALVGATGAGKTTVTSLLLRLYDFQEGVVRVLGKDVRDYDRRALRDLFSVVPQDVFLFAGTVASNVAMSTSADPGVEGPDLARVEKALVRIGALDLFLRRPGGLDARVDERGANFSAGERQLLAFARALYKDTPLLILDEATASIDSDTEARLQAALEAVMLGRTALVIAHRLSTIRAVDRIVVFHRGRIVEAGSHDQLLAKDGVYARLYRHQFAQEVLQQEEARANALPPPVPGE
jgi:ATP-binding cassette, subfamily B, multidrug efflux pump